MTIETDPDLPPEPPPVDLRVSIGGLRLRTPLMAAAGCGGFGQELARLNVLDRLGALVTPSLSASSRVTNHRVRLTEAPSSLVLPTDWPTVGADTIQPTRVPWDSDVDVPVIPSLVGTTSGEFGAAASALRRRTLLHGVGAVEVNLACRDEGNKGVPFSHADFTATKVVSRVREELPRDVPVLAKLSADVTDIVEIAKACVRAGAEGLVVTSPLRAVSMDGLRLSLPATSAGLSGPALLPITLRAVYDLAAAVRAGRLPPVAIIAVGGIRSGHDAAQAMALGAVAVQWGTALLHDPKALMTFDDELADELRQRGLRDVRDLVGLAYA